MSKKDFTDSVKDFFNRNSKIKNLIVICLVLVFVLIAMNVVGSSREIGRAHV